MVLMFNAVKFRFNDAQLCKRVLATSSNFPAYMANLLTAHWSAVLPESWRYVHLSVFTLHERKLGFHVPLPRTAGMLQTTAGGNYDVDGLQMTDSGTAGML